MPSRFYGQTEVTKDLMETRIAAGARLIFEAHDVSVEGFDPRASHRALLARAGEHIRSPAIFIAGCDGLSRASAGKSIPTEAMQSFERIYPFGWLGILADVSTAPRTN